MLSNKPTSRDIKLAKSLVHPDKEIRDATILSLKQYLTNLETVEELEMLKLWKALYYCYWLADKQAIQQELAENLSSLIFSSSVSSSSTTTAAEALKNNEMILCYIKCFFHIILREWSYLDIHRMNKFYLFIRIFLNHIFQYYAIGSEENMKSEEKSKKTKKTKKGSKKNDEENHENTGHAIGNKKSWKDINEFHNILINEILTKTPNGIRYHICDIYLEELSKVTKGKGLSSEDFLTILSPFLSALIRNDDLNYIERVYTTIFYKFLKEYSYEAMKEAGDDDHSANGHGNGNEKKHYYFEEINTKALQKRIFELASSPETNERFRKKLYELHKAISLKTGIPFIPDDMDVLSAPPSLSSSSNGKKGSASSSSTSSSSSSFLSIDSKPSSSSAVVGDKRRLDDDIEDMKEVEGATGGNSQQVMEKEEKKTVNKKQKKEKHEDNVKHVVDNGKSEKLEIVGKGIKEPVAPEEEKKETKVIKEGKGKEKAEKKKKQDKKDEKEDIPLLVNLDEKKKPSSSSVSAPAPATPVTDAAPPTFIEAKKFQGAKPGYIFQKVSLFYTRFAVILTWDFLSLVAVNVLGKSRCRIL
jgi:hypothetical protein